MKKVSYGHIRSSLNYLLAFLERRYTKAKGTKKYYKLVNNMTFLVPFCPRKGVSNQHSCLKWGGGVSFYFKMIPSQGNLDLSAKVGEVQCSYIVTCQNIFGVLCTGRVLCKYVNYLPLLYYITYMYAVLLWVNILTYNIKYYHMQSPALFKNIFKFCTFLTKFSNILPFFKKLHAYPLSIIGPEYAN